MREDNQNLISEGLPEWKLKLSYFYVNHKISIKRGLVFFLFFADILVIVFFAIIFINYQAGTTSDEGYMRQMPVNLVDHQTVKNHYSPDALVLSDAYLISATGDKSHVLFSINNSNEEWAITEIEYAIIFDEQEDNQFLSSTFLLPKSTKYISAFNQDKATSAKLEILNTKWQRVKDYTLFSYQEGVTTKDAIYSSSVSGGAVSFTVFNDTPYNYWEVGLTVVLYNRFDEPVGLDYIVAEKLISGEERQLTINWLDPVASSYPLIKIYPEVNLLNSNSIMKIDTPPGSPPGSE